MLCRANRKGVVCQSRVLHFTQIRPGVSRFFGVASLHISHPGLYQQLVFLGFTAKLFHFASG